MGKAFKKDAKVVIEVLSGMKLDDIIEKEKDLESSGQVLTYYIVIVFEGFNLKRFIKIISYIY